MDASRAAIKRASHTWGLTATIRCGEEVPLLRLVAGGTGSRKLWGIAQLLIESGPGVRQTGEEELVGKEALLAVTEGNTNASCKPLRRNRSG